MDYAQLSAIAITILTPLYPYLTKAGEAAASEVGKEIVAQAKTLYITLKHKFDQTNDDPAKSTLESLDKAPDEARRQLTISIARQAQADTGFAQALSSQVKDIQILLFDCLQKKFLTRDLKQVYFKLGLGWNDLVGGVAGRGEKAIALIEEMTAKERIPDLIRVMWDVYPGLRC